MRMKLAALAGLTLLAPASALGDELYFKAEGGLGVAGSVENDLIEADLEAGWQAGGGLGYDFAGPLRLEADLFYTDNDIDTEGLGFDASASSFGGFVTVLADLGSGPVRPFVGAGVGYVNGELEAAAQGVTLSTDESAVGFVGRAGLTFARSPTLAWDIGYRLQYAEFDDTEATTHAITAAIRFASPSR